MQAQCWASRRVASRISETSLLALKPMLSKPIERGVMGASEDCHQIVVLGFGNP
jgi:hypothetical protein